MYIHYLPINNWTALQTTISAVLMHVATKSNVLMNTILKRYHQIGYRAEADDHQVL